MNRNRHANRHPIWLAFLSCLVGISTFAFADEGYVQLVDGSLRRVSPDDAQAVSIRLPIADFQGASDPRYEPTDGTPYRFSRGYIASASVPVTSENRGNAIFIRQAFDPNQCSVNNAPWTKYFNFRFPVTEINPAFERRPSVVVSAKVTDIRSYGFTVGTRSCIQILNEDKGPRETSFSVELCGKRQEVRQANLDSGHEKFWFPAIKFENFDFSACSNDSLMNVSLQITDPQELLFHHMQIDVIF